MSGLLVFDLIQLAQREYEINQCPYARVFPSQAKNVLAHMGGLEAEEVTFDVVEGYKLLRIRAGAARDTINKEIGGLKKGFRLALDAKLVEAEQIPVFRRLRPGRPRTGFLYIDEFRRVCVELTPDVRDVAEFAYWSGWRLGEIRRLQWMSVNDEWAWCYSKNGDTKLAPIEGHLHLVMERRRQQRNGEWVFHRAGRQIKSVRKGWIGACKRAGVDGRVFHDMRRSFCRNGIRAGIDRDTVMKLSGHRSDSVFRRYNIQDERDLREAAKRLGET